MTLLDGVELTALAMRRDNRGWLAEIFRDEWSVGIEPRQWNVSMSEQNVLRGAHIQGRHKDYLMVLDGKVTVGLYVCACPKVGRRHRSDCPQIRQCGTSSCVDRSAAQSFCASPSLCIFLRRTGVTGYPSSAQKSYGTGRRSSSRRTMSCAFGAT
jgi:hypothetical protein